MKVSKLKLIGNDNVRVYRNPETGEEEMYVSEDLVPQSVANMCLRVIGDCENYTYRKAGPWNIFFAMKKEQDELRQLLRR